LLLLQNRKLGK